MAYRVETYIHSDSITENKGGCIAQIEAQTESATKTKEFIRFARRVPVVMYMVGATSWSEIMLHSQFEPVSELVADKFRIENLLKEKIGIGDVFIVPLPCGDGRYRCIFCDFKGDSVKELREHSSECEKHPLWARIEQLLAEDKE